MPPAGVIKNLTSIQFVTPFEQSNVGSLMSPLVACLANQNSTFSIQN